jgi:predicted cupin superfamily sugar epimerase
VKVTQNAMKTAQLIKSLELEPHIEGGYFRRTYQSDGQTMVTTCGAQRHCMTSIFYLLTQDSSIGHFHLNQSDIVHYYHLGDPIQYTLIFPDRTLKTIVMGNDILAGQCLQLHVPGGIWKASQLMQGPAGFGLISEAVSPGFDFADMEMGDRQKLGQQFPEHWVPIEKLTRG